MFQRSLTIRAVLPIAVVLAVGGYLVASHTGASGNVTNCMTGPVTMLERQKSAPREIVDVELSTSCDPPHPFQLSGVETGGDDYTAIGVASGGTDTCLHRVFKAKGERCMIQVFFDPRMTPQPGRYESNLTFQYAGENEVFIIWVDGYVK